MAFVSVQQENLYNDIIKTWITHIKNTWDFTGVTFRVDTPDTDIALNLPTIVLKQVSNGEWDLNRVLWNFWEKNSDDDFVRTLYWYTYSTMFQFDIVTTTISENNILQWKLLNTIKPATDFFDTLIPLRHFNTPNDTIWTETDLKIQFTFYKDIHSANIPSFDPNLHQHSLSIKFKVDYLSEVEVARIKSIHQDYNIY